LPDSTYRSRHETEQNPTRRNPANIQTEDTEKIECTKKGKIYTHKTKKIQKKIQKSKKNKNYKNSKNKKRGGKQSCGSEN